jgi:hypothetical protein
VANDDTALVGRILLIGAAVLALFGALSWMGTLPVAPGARQVLALAFGIAAAGDCVIGLFLLRQPRDSRP